MSDFRVALLSGAAAGTAVDVSLFPLDTIKTRLQSEAGFFKSGGFRGVYAGLPSVLIGSAPGAALFFCSYELVKTQSGKVIGKKWEPVSHMLAASVGEVSACLIRVPVEVVKQRAQTLPHLSSLSILSSTLKDEGLRGLYRGYMSTVLREVPFSLIQFPLWEYFKKRWSGFQGYPVDPWQSSVCGAVAGAISSAITTPTDVAKTRIMLAKSGSPLSQGSIVYALRHVYSEKGIRGLFAGIVPRVVWITIGGAIFLGIYDKSKAVLTSYNMAY